jgi:hypothetical protein
MIFMLKFVSAASQKLLRNGTNTFCVWNELGLFINVMPTVIVMADYLWSVDVEEQAILVTLVSFVKEGLHVWADSALC